MHAYLIAVLLLWGTAPMALASHAHGKWIEPRAPSVPTLWLYFAVLAGLVAVGLALLGPGMLADGRWPGAAASLPVGWFIATATWRCDRRILRLLGDRPVWKAAQPHPAERGGAARPVGIAALGGRPETRETGRRPASSNRWGREERSREIHVGPALLITGAVLEELVYRGAFQRFALTECAWPCAVLLLAAASAAFACSHLPFGWAQAAAKVPLSLMALTATLVTGTVLAAVVGHVWFNIRVYRHHRAAFGAQGTAGASR